MIIKNSLFGTLITLLCLLPPLIHFITGPLGPFIGGYVSGMRKKQDRSSSPIIIGGLIGVFLTLAITGLGLPILLVAKSNTDSISTSMMDFIPISVLILLWGSSLGSLGNFFGQRSSRKIDTQKIKSNH